MQPAMKCISILVLSLDKCIISMYHYFAVYIVYIQRKYPTEISHGARVFGYYHIYNLTELVI